MKESSVHRWETYQKGVARSAARPWWNPSLGTQFGALTSCGNWGGCVTKGLVQSFGLQNKPFLKGFSVMSNPPKHHNNDSGLIPTSNIQHDRSRFFNCSIKHWRIKGAYQRRGQAAIGVPVCFQSCSLKLCPAAGIGDALSYLSHVPMGKLNLGRVRTAVRSRRSAVQEECRHCLNSSRGLHQSICTIHLIPYSAQGSLFTKQVHSLLGLLSLCTVCTFPGKWTSADSVWLTSSPFLTFSEEATCFCGKRPTIPQHEGAKKLLFF